VKNLENTFIRFDRIHKCDQRTDRQTDGHRMTASAALTHSTSRQKLTAPDSLTEISVYSFTTTMKHVSANVTYMMPSAK